MFSSSVKKLNQIRYCLPDPLYQLPAWVARRIDILLFEFPVVNFRFYTSSNR